jgi:IS605 OrfB family transposase
MKAYSVKVKFSAEEDKQKLLTTLSLQRCAWNVISLHRFTMSYGSLKVLHDKSYRNARNKVPELPAQYVCKAMGGVIAAYQAIRANRQKVEAPAIKKGLSTQLDNHLFRWKNIEKTEFSVTAVGGKRVECSLTHYDKIKNLDWSRMRWPSIFVRNGEVYLTLIFEDETPFIDSKKCIGLDLGIRRIVATSNGDIIQDKVGLKHRRKIRFLKRQLQAKIHSRAAKKHLRSLKRREHNFNRNRTHILVNKTLQLAGNASTIVIEDLKGVKRTRGFKKQGNMKSQWNPFEFRRILTYKAQARGKRVVTVRPYLTSQTDHRGLEGGTRSGCRFIGSDGVVLDADVNAAINILHKYDPKHPVSCSALDGQAHVNVPYVNERATALTSLQASY